MTETRSKERIARWKCKDCGKDCQKDNRDYYMIQHELWDKYGVGDGMLCMNCIETRLGRKLTAEDILPCFLTGILNDYTKNILLGH